MKIAAVNITSMRLLLKQPYVWSQGIEEAWNVNLIEMVGEDGSKGYGETTTAPDMDAQAIVLRKLARSFMGKSVFSMAKMLADAYRANFLAFGGNMPRYFNQLASGFDMAALDLQGKITGRPVWDLLGGAVRPDVDYFYFLQGETTEALVKDARRAVTEQQPVIYLKVGMGAERDMEAVAAVRQAIGKWRLRLDANEAWDPATTLRMLERLKPYDIEYLEQPTASGSQRALQHVVDRSDLAIGADQSVFTLHEVFTACTTHRADMIAVGPREIGGLRPMMKAAAVAEAAGLNVCIHSSMTTGITTCAEHHVGRAIRNLDDGNQIMWQLLQDNIVSSPALSPVKGKLALPEKPGLGFELDVDVINRAAERHKRFGPST